MNQCESQLNVSSLSVDATHGTHLYFDDETRASETFVASFPDHYFDSSTSPPKKGSVKKIEAVHVSELNTYVTNSPPQVHSQCISMVILHNLITIQEPVL
ncbi:hypothetical protein YC2023_008987 [Brassica napus]